jgi:cell division protein FtsZ
VAASEQAAPAESALKELAGKMRAENARLADRVERASAPAEPTESVESAAHAAVAAALLPSTGIDDVSLRPMPMKPSLFDAAPAESAPPPAEAPPAEAFIPPQPERTMRTPRMPRIDELPVPAQNEIRAQRGETTAENHPEKQRLSLMQRLAQVGLGGRREESEAPRAPRTAQAAPQFERQARPTARQPEGRPAEPVSEYARRPAPQGLDPHGRHAPVHNSPEDDQLDIPAFLRRQAN